MGITNKLQMGCVGRQWKGSESYFIKIIFVLLFFLFCGNHYLLARTGYPNILHLIKMADLIKPGVLLSMPCACPSTESSGVWPRSADSQSRKFLSG